MKKMTLKMRLFGGVVAVSMAFFAVSCADGAPDDERVEIGVYDTQLETPALDASNFAKVTNPDGSESIMVTWPVVLGAKGYLCNVNIVDDPTNPEVIVADSLVDDSSISFPAREETKYEFSLRTIGDPERGNLDAVEAVTAAYSTMVPAIVVPAGEISEFIMANLVDSNEEQAFELAPDTEYTLEDKIDFGLNQFTLRGDKIRRAVVTVKKNGCIMTQAGLKVKWINFDCSQEEESAMTSAGLITLSDNPDASISTESLGYKAAGANQNGFVIEKTVLIQECWIKNLPNALLYGSKKPWSLRDFRVIDCIVQSNNVGSYGIFDLGGGGNGLIKSFTVKNNTFYNLTDDANGYFLNYSNSSNSQPKKVFGTGDDSAEHLWENNTFVKTFTKKKFGNQTPQYNKVTLTMNNNIMVDVHQVYQYLHRNNNVYTNGNTIWYVSGSEQSNDTGGYKDKNGNPYFTIDDPGFSVENLSALDFSQPNGGVNFKPSGALNSTIGDPRWLE